MSPRLGINDPERKNHTDRVSVEEGRCFFCNHRKMFVNDSMAGQWRRKCARCKRVQL